MNHWIYDKETLSNCYVSVYEDYVTDEIHVFVIHDLRNDLTKLAEFLETAIVKQQRFIGFNNLAFDSQIQQFIIKNYKKWIRQNLSGCEIAILIYEQAQNTIDRSNSREFSEFPEWKQDTKQIDLFKMNHWDNPAKSSSLKWIQYSMDWHNVQEMPIEHTEVITTQQQIDKIISYCINDVRSTKQVYVKSKDQLKLRQALTKEYNINLYSASEPRISKELFGFFLSQRLDIDKTDLKVMRTPRDRIVAKDIILPYIKFTTPEFQSVLDFFNSKVITETKGALAYSIKHKGVKTDYGSGGIHGCREKGIYKAGNGMIIMTSDVTSFYPNLAIRNKWAPAHLPKEDFCELYEWFFEERKKIPKKDPKNYVYKIILNSTYGLSNDANSFLYDPEFTMRITINGQLTLSMLYEMLSTRIPGSVPIMQNTDGIEMMVPEEHYQLYMNICKEWEQLTSLELEHDQYQKIMLFDVNNYIAVNKEKQAKSKEDWDEVMKTNPFYPSRIVGDRYYYTPVKCKGRFEFHELPLHKNKSFLIIPKAIYHFLINGIKPETYLKNNQNIFDYCGGVKAKGDWTFQEHSIVDGEHQVNPLQKVIRYYISKQGVKIVKVNPHKKTVIQIEAGRWMQTTMNIYVDKPFDEYGINLDYYLEGIYNEINSIDSEVSRAYTQLRMF